MTTGQLARAFRETRYEIAGTVARPGRRAPEMLALLRRMGAREGAILTAWNPLARRCPEGWNRRANKRLDEACRRIPMRRGHGRGRNWAEEHRLLATRPGQAIRLARRFRQLAILLVPPSGCPRLRWLRL